MKGFVIFPIAIVGFLTLGNCARVPSVESNAGTSVVVIEDSDFERAEKEFGAPENRLQSEGGREEASGIGAQKGENFAAANGSEIKVTTMTDSAGNRVEIRSFENDPLVKSVVARTAVNGEIRVTVYAWNGDVKRIDKESGAKILRASGGEIARIAKIYQTRNDRKLEREFDLRRREEQIDAEREERLMAGEPNSNEPIANPPAQTASLKPPVNQPQN